MAPPGLNHADARVGKEMDDLLQQVALRYKVGIEDRDEFTGGLMQSVLQSARFVSVPVGPMNVMNREPLLA